LSVHGNLFSAANFPGYLSTRSLIIVHLLTNQGYA
jgi:hypothetical protein